MKKIFIGLCIIAIIVVVAFFILGYLSKNGEALGLKDGKLQACPNSPNCVFSESNISESHYISPFAYTDDTAVFLTKIKQVIENLQGEITSSEGNYLSATFTSSIFGFVDDLELRLEESEGKKLLHFRSSSRVGRSDLGANKKRVEIIKAKLMQK